MPTPLPHFAAPNFRRIAGAWRHWRRRIKAKAELEALGREADAVARDLGMGGAELVVLATRAPESADLLNERMASLAIDQRQLTNGNRAVLLDLQRTCSGCVLKSRCRRDLKHRAADVAGYCPNEHTLSALKKA